MTVSGVLTLFIQGLTSVINNLISLGNSAGFPFLPFLFGAVFLTLLIRLISKLIGGGDDSAE